MKKNKVIQLSSHPKNQQPKKCQCKEMKKQKQEKIISIKQSIQVEIKTDFFG